MSGRYSLLELARQAEVPARTIRFYIARGLLSGPRLAGRKAEYDQAHLDRIKEIRGLQSKGLTLAEIAAAGAKNDEGPALPVPSPSLRYALGEDADVYVRADLPPWRMNRIRKAIGELNRMLRQDGNTEVGRQKSE